MGTCVEKISHSCGTRQGLQVYEKEGGEYDGFCFSCGTYVPDPYKNKPKGYKPTVTTKTPEEIEEQIAEIKSYRTLGVPKRKILAEYMEYFGVKTSVSEEDRDKPTAVFFPYDTPTGLTYKVRMLDKKAMWAVGSLKGAKPFGWKQAVASGAKRLIITEGEFDAIAIFQMMKERNKHVEKYASFNPAVISLPSGAGCAKKVLSELLSDIRKNFKEVSLAFDMDEAGRKAVEEVVNIMPSALVAELPEKDANDCLIAGKSKACVDAVMFKATESKNTRLVSAEDLHEAAREQAPYGVSWPWKYITEKTRGIRKGETYYFGAAQKMGKSELVNAIGAHLIKEHGWKILLAKPEEANKKSYKMLAGKVVGKIFHDPKVEFDYDAYDRAGEVIKGKALMIDLYQHLGWETLKDDITAAAARGTDAVFIDPITNLTNGMSSGDINTTLQGVAQELAAMAKDLDIAIFIFCHLNKVDKGSQPHDRGGKVLTNQFAGSSAMGRSCNYMFGFEGNKDPDLSDEERNTRSLVILDDREYGEVGRCRLYWDSKTGMFNEIGG